MRVQPEKISERPFDVAMQELTNTAVRIKRERDALREALRLIELDCSGLIGNISNQTPAGSKAIGYLEHIGKRARAAIAKVQS